jgi:hypothetical protein
MYICIEDLQLSMQSVPITTKVVSLKPVHDEVYSKHWLCDKVCQWLATGWWFSLGTPVSSTYKTDRHVWNSVESGIKHPNPLK